MLTNVEYSGWDTYIHIYIYTYTYTRILADPKHGPRGYSTPRKYFSSVYTHIHLTLALRIMRTWVGVLWDYQR